MKQIIIDQLLKDGIKSNQLCQKCTSDLEMTSCALTPYVISNSLTPESERVMFVGKTARGDDFDESININDWFQDVTAFGAKYLKGNSSAFYSYTREIVECYYGNIENAMKYISLSNIMKCNNETDPDTTPYEAMNNCIKENQFIWKEISIVNPKRIIFYTHSYYDDFIDFFRPLNCMSYKDVCDKSYQIPNGKRNILFWHRDFFDKRGQLICSFLRTSHPMCKKKDDFIKSTLDWLNQTR